MTAFLLLSFWPPFARTAPRSPASREAPGRGRDTHRRSCRPRACSPRTRWRSRSPRSRRAGSPRRRAARPRWPRRCRRRRRCRCRWCCRCPSSPCSGSSGCPAGCASPPSGTPAGCCCGGRRPATAPRSRLWGLRDTEARLSHRWRRRPAHQRRVAEGGPRDAGAPAPATVTAPVWKHPRRRPRRVSPTAPCLSVPTLRLDLAARGTLSELLRGGGVVGANHRNTNTGAGVDRTRDGRHLGFRELGARSPCHHPQKSHFCSPSKQLCFSCFHQTGPCTLTWPLRVPYCAILDTCQRWA